MGYLRSYGYTWIDSGFEGKTIWNWLELLIIPGTLAVVAIILDNRERKADRELTRDNQREAALQNYFDALTRLILDKDLRNSEPEDEVRDIAQVKTITTLKRLDSDRKSKLVRFLGDVSLVEGGDKTQPIISLRFVNLENTDLVMDYLNGADLFCANLRDTCLLGAHLEGANLFAARLEGADLRDTHLEGADLRDAILRGANLEGADLEGSDLLGAHLNGATMPDGKKYDPAIHTIELLTGLKDTKN